jgi:hypothetical protein
VRGRGGVDVGRRHIGEDALLGKGGGGDANDVGRRHIGEHRVQDEVRGGEEDLGRGEVEERLWAGEAARGGRISWSAVGEARFVGGAPVRGGISRRTRRRLPQRGGGTGITRAGAPARGGRADRLREAEHGASVWTPTIRTYRVVEIIVGIFINGNHSSYEQFTSYVLC